MEHVANSHLFVSILQYAASICNLYTSNLLSRYWVTAAGMCLDKTDHHQNKVSPKQNAKMNDAVPNVLKQVKWHETTTRYSINSL